MSEVLKITEISKPKFFNWKSRKGLPNFHNGLQPKDSWILPEERQAIIDYYLKNPLNGCRRLSYMMIDEDIAYVSHNTVHRVLKAEGLIDDDSRKPSLKGTGFTQPTSVHQQWHIDVSYINAGGTFYYLCSVLDGYSRFIVHWEIHESMKQEDCQLVVQRAREKMGTPHARLISDNGPQFRSRQFKEFIRLCGMDQTFTSPYYPQSNGKIERWHKELKKECIRSKQPDNLTEARNCVGKFVEEYNYLRLHSAIGYVTPYDRMLSLDTELQESRRSKLKLARENRSKRWLTIRDSDLHGPVDCADSKPDHRLEPPSPLAGAATVR